MLQLVELIVKYELLNNLTPVFSRRLNTSFFSVEVNPALDQAPSTSTCLVILSKAKSDHCILYPISI